MSKLYFKIGADYDKVIRLRDEIAKLRKELLSMNMVANSSNFSALERQLNRTTQEFDRLIQQAAAAATQMQNTTININHTTSSLGGMNSMLAKIGGTVALSKLASDIIRVRGEFQAADTAIQTLLGSKEKADALMKQVREYAKISPLEFSDVTAATQMMLGFNIEAEKVPRFISAIGDVSMGEAQKFNSLTLAFSQMSATGKLMGQDLNQMINAGFNPLQQIAQTTGKSIATLKEEMSKGAISTEMVQKAFIDATSAGGKFYQMSENASKTINGQLSMMQDAMDAAFNEMGQKSEGIIMSGIQLTTSLIENYETIGKVLVGMIATYGVYKTALITNIALTRSWAVAARVDATAKGIQTIATKAQTIAQLALNAAMKANPYVLAATLLVGAATAMWAFSDSTTAAERAQKKYNKTKADSLQKEEEHKSRLEDLIATIQNEYTSSMNRVKAIEAIKKEYPSLFQKYIDEKGHIKDLIGLWKEYNEEVTKNKIETNKKNLSDSTAKIEEYEKMLSLWKKLGENPYYRKKRLSEEEFELAEKYKGETESSLRRKLELAKPSRDLYQKEVRSDELAQWQLDLKKSTDIQIKTELEEMKRLQQARKNNKRYSLNVGVGSLKGSTTESELANRIDVLQSEYNSRSKTTYKVDYEKAKKEWNEAKKTLSEIEKDKSKFTSKQYEDAKKRSETTEKAYKDLGGVTGSALTKQESAAEKRKKEAEKQKKEQQKSAEELLTLRRQNQQDEINLMKDGTEKKLKQIDLDYQKELDSIRKQESKWSKEQGGKLTQEQSIEISTRYTNAENKKEKDIADVTKEQLKAEQQALNDYLKDYGTFQQQKLAIAQEYAEKIKKAQEENGINSTQVKLLEKQRDVAIQNKETEAIKANIDWVTVFGEFGGMFNDMIRPTLEEAKKYVQTDKFKNSDQTSQKALIDAIGQMEKSLGGVGGLNFKKLGQDMQIYQNSLRELNDAKNEEAEAINKLVKAQEDYEKAIKSGTEEEKQAAKDARDTAQQNADVASANVQTQTNVANESQQNLTDTATKLKVNMDNVVEGLSKLASGGISSAYQGLLQAGSAMKGAIGEVTKNLKDVPIIGWIVAIIDVFKDGLSNLVGGLLDAIFNAVSGILGDILSGDLFVTIGKSLRDGIGNILNSISFGGWDSLMNKISGSNAKEVQEAIDKLTDRNETLGKSIDRLTEVMDKAAGSKSISAYEQAFKYQQEQITNTLKIAQEQAGYHSSHKSWQHYMEWTDEQLRWARENVDKNFSGTDSLWGLSPEQMKTLLSNANIYEQIRNEGKGGYGGRVLEKLEAYADQAGKLDELTEKINESLMQVSFDGLRDNFLESLMDMDKDAKSFSEDFSEYMQRALLNFSMGELFDDELREWYNGIAKLMKEQGGKLTKQQLEDARKEYDSIVQDALNERDTISEITGYEGDSSSSQESTKKGFAAASQDSIDELNGRFTALQIAGEEIKNQNILQFQSLNILTVKADSILSVNTDTRNIADEIRTIQVNSFLELQEIRENTGAIIKPIKDMAADIAEVKKNTSKL